MTTGRNDPCPCGSGKKYKKCCMNKGAGAGSPSSPATAADNARQLIGAPPRPRPPSPPAAAPPRRPRSPEEERANAHWKEFEAAGAEEREAIFLATLDDPELMTDELAFEMLLQLRQGARASGERPRLS